MTARSAPPDDSARADQAEAMRRRANADIAAGRLRRAVRLLDRAIALVAPATSRSDGAAAAAGSEATRDVRVLHACLLTSATATLALDGVTAAHAVLERARVLAGTDPDLVTRWRAQRGLVLGRSGDLAGAERELGLVTENLAVFTDQERCSILLNRGMVAVESGRPSDAIPLFAEAAATASRAGLPRQRFMALHNAGYAAYLTGDLPQALAGMDAADDVAADVFHGPALFDRGRVLHEAGLLTESLDVLQEAAAACGRRGHDLLRGEIHLETARVLLLLSDPAGAARSAQAARARFMRAGARAWAARADETRLSARLATGRGLARLATLAAELEPAAIETGDVELQSRVACLAAEIAARRGFPDQAQDALARAPEADLGLAARLGRARADVVVGLATGRTDAAAATLQRAASWLESSQAASASLDSRAARAVLGASLAALDLDLAVGSGEVTRVLAALERWSVAGRALPVVRPPRDEGAAEVAQHLRSLLRSLRDEPGSPQAPAWRAEAAALRRRLSAASHATAQPSPIRTTGDGACGKHATEREPADLLSLIDAQGRDLWWLFARHDILWVTGCARGAEFLRPLGALSRVRENVRRIQADLRALPQRQLGPMRGSIQSSLRSGLSAVSALVPVPDRPVVIVECGETHGVPWAMLPPLHGVPVTVARAASEWLENRRVGAPEIALLRGPGLTHDLAELAAVSGAWSGCGVVREASAAATSDVALSALGHAEVVHVAAHGRHRPDSPLFSSLRLADGDLFAHELQGLPIRAGHVVLSACDVGAVAVRPGGEPLGLAGALVSLGVASVVASLAPVADDAAADLMTWHHRGLAAGLESDAALANASVRVPAAATFVATGSTWRCSTLPETTVAS